MNGVAGPPTRLAAGDQVGPYRLEQELGEGGMGVVYRARTPDGERVALKLARTSLAADETFRRRFQREGHSTTRVDHPNVVRVLDAGEHGGLSYLTQSYMPGGSLAEQLERSGPLPVPAVVRLAHEVAGGLDALHEAGLIHRDLKPDNILFDSRGTAHITDFGLIKDLKASVVTKLGAAVGTWNYMAPEQVRGEDARPAIDIYALGCVLFACLAGSPPFGDRRGMQVGWAHLNEEPPDPSASRPDVPADVGWAVTKALAKEPEDRPPTAVALARLVQVAAQAGGDR